MVLPNFFSYFKCSFDVSVISLPLRLWKTRQSSASCRSSCPHASWLMLELGTHWCTRSSSESSWWTTLILLFTSLTGPLSFLDVRNIWKYDLLLTLSICFLASSRAAGKLFRAVMAPGSRFPSPRAWSSCRGCNRLLRCSLTLFLAVLHHFTLFVHIQTMMVLPNLSLSGRNWWNWLKSQSLLRIYYWPTGTSSVSVI